ncbi:MFS transporter [Clostridium magnum]|uniref:Putative symporter YjmB n=1 Tax=Clostridium magnum DSM 2767 TaxID=1121326 RepID=A0A161YHX3_9CLOT|nr:MFS transporter [Clostridium magnum]KZL89892.1 putative symporter YjmB [Clostridium magnum DSM 2767]SHI46445.1 glycoside/pentoside/hexuronide:cation symporter, GPH family [Clostridium magnum DSM 2767]
MKNKLTLKEKISYGFGDFGNGFMFDLGQAFLMKFYTDVCGIGAALAAGVFTFTKIFDAFMDTVAGSAIDAKKPGKNGKFRSIMMISSIILAVLTVFTFWMPNFSKDGMLIYAYASYMMWGVLYSFTNVPYGSLGSVMTQDVQERSQLASFRQAGSLGALLITNIAFIPIVRSFSNPRVGYVVAAAVMSVVGVVSFYICFKNTREVIQPAARKVEKASAKDYAKVVLGNKPLLCLILMTVFTISASNIKNGMMVYFCQYYLGNVTFTSYINFVMIGSSIIGITFMPKLVKKYGKKKTAIIGFTISIIADALNFILPVNIFTFAILVSIGFLGMSIPNGITWAFVSDAIDYGEWHTGQRKEGITYAAFNFSRKIAQSVAAGVSGSVLALTGYVANAQQSAKTLAGIKGLMTLYPAVAIGIAALVIGVLYKLSDKKYNEIIADLQAGKFESSANSVS